MTWGEAFLWTCAIETPVYLLLLRRSLRGAGVPGSWAAGLVIGISLQLLTHPALWYAWPLDWPYWKAFFVGEALVVIAEGAAVSLLLIALRERRPIARGFAIAFLANALSAAIGLLF